MIIKVQQQKLTQQKDQEDKEIHGSVQSAINAASPGDVIHIGAGVYNEKLHVTTSGLTLKGDSVEGSILQYGDYARKEHEDGGDYGTFRSYTCLIHADDVILENLTIENSAGDGDLVGQAVALYAEGDRLQFINCHFIGHQDTIFAGPLPEAPKTPGSFKGPTENKAYRRSKQYFENCRVTGDVDYIFGSAQALFNGCRIITRNRHKPVNGYVTAPSTWQHETYGFVFVNCDFRGESGIQEGTVFFGRPWRAYGQVDLINCTYDACIHTDHWDPWGSETNKETARFSEYGCRKMVGGKSVADNISDLGPFIRQYADYPELSDLDPWHQSKLSTNS